MRQMLQRWRDGYASAGARLRALLTEYGLLAIVVWYAVFGVTILAAAGLLELGPGWPWLDSKVGELGTWAGAYLVAKLLQPLRFGVVAAVLPFAARLRSRLTGKTTEP